MTTDPTPPEVGSLWQHKDGERRFVTCDCGGGLWYASTPLRPELHTGEENYITIAEWSAWERDAVRIDKEQT